MLFNRRILVAIKGSVDPRPVLVRARLIAERLDAEVVLMAASRSLVSEAEAYLLQAEKELTDAGIRVQRYGRKLRDPLQELMLVAAELKCGLLIKAPDHPRGLADTLLTPRDWKLLRYAPCPVLIVKQADAWEGQRLLAAVDVAPGDDAHQSLNRQIIELASLIAQLSNSEMELVTAYPTPMQSTNRSQQSADQLHDDYLAQAQQLCQQLQVDPAAILVDEGPAETLIPAQVQARNAALVVLGTVARRGLSAALLGGNTAEAILSKLSCDVLCVQPQDGDQVLSLLRSTADPVLAPTAVITTVPAQTEDS